MRTRALLLCASIALMGMWACQRETSVADNPTYNPDDRTVNTQFVLNVSTGNGAPSTKQSAADVQVGGAAFRGITDAHILAYNLGYAGVGGAHYLYKPLDESSKALRDYNMGTVIREEDISSNRSSRVLELALPLGTNAILMYGRAPLTATINEQGVVDYSGVALNTTLDNVSFKLASRLQDAEGFQQYGDLMGRILTGLMSSARNVQTTANGYKAYYDNTYWFWWPLDSDSTQWNSDPNGGKYSDGNAIESGNTTFHPGYTLYRGSKSWREYGEAYAKNQDDDNTNNVELKALEEVVGETYFEIMHLKGEGDKTELRAASSASVLRLTGDLFAILNRVLNAKPTSPEEYIAQLVAEEAHQRGTYFFKLDDNQNVIYQSWDVIKDGVNAMIPDRTSANYNKVTQEYFYSEADGRPGYPINLGLPMGAAIMDFLTVGAPGNQYDVVRFLSEIPAYGMGTDAKFSVANYRYPAELTYFVNSSIRTSDVALTSNDFPASLTAWNQDGYWGNDWQANGSVNSTTRAVAVTKAVNYGTAMLKATFAYSDVEVEDNNGGIHAGEANNKISVSSGNKFQVTGIMIGGVNDEVGWDFLPKGPDFNKMVYDNLAGNYFYIPPYTGDSDGESTPIYTLTWDNYNKDMGPNEQNKVYIGLELVNNTGEDIWGELNIIRKGGTFYLVGELDPNASGATDKLTKDAQGKVNLARTDCFYPPFDENGNTINALRVFMQDYVTSARFNFTKTSLQHAYVTMPDLRAGQVSLGMSVDLEWKAGMEFDVNMGDHSGSTNTGN